MKIISRKFHAVLDYLSGFILIIAPWVLDFNDSNVASAVAVVAGVLILIMSVMTDYEGGLVRTIPMSTHLNMDVVLGILLAASPWLFNFDEAVYLPHLILGLLAIASGFLTDRVSLSNRIAK